LATLTMVLAAEAPDLDVLYYFGGSVTGFQHHRGFTHSLVGAPLVAVAVVAGVYGLYRLLQLRGWRPKLTPRWGLLFVYALLGTLSHIFLDFANNYGVRPFAPFNPRWYSWDIVFIVDPLILAGLLLGLIVPSLLGLVTEEVGAGHKQFRGRGGAIFALACLVAIMAVRDFEHRRAVSALNAIAYRGEDPIRVSAFPQILNPFSWNGVVETRDSFVVVPVESSPAQVDPQNQTIIRYKPEETPVTLAAKRSRLGRVFLDWAAYPLVETEALPARAGYRVRFQDLRFASVEGMTRRRSTPLSGTVELDPKLRVEDEYMGERANDK
jgi:inner membrane protein